MRGILLAFLLSGCGYLMSGTAVDPVGTSHMSVVSGPDGVYTFELHDGKDRTGGVLKITMPDGTTIE